MKIAKRILRIFFGWLYIGTAKLESQNIEAIIANLEEEKQKAKENIFSRMVSIKTSINAMEKQTEKLGQDYRTYKERAIKALKLGKEELAADLALKSENTKQQLDVAISTFSEASRTYEELSKKQVLIVENYDTRIEQIKIKAATTSMNEELASIQDLANMAGSNTFNGLLQDIDGILDKKDSKAQATTEVSKVFNAQDAQDSEDSESIASIDKSEALQRLKDSVSFSNN